MKWTTLPLMLGLLVLVAVPFVGAEYDDFSLSTDYTTQVESFTDSFSDQYSTSYDAGQYSSYSPYFSDPYQYSSSSAFFDPFQDFSTDVPLDSLGYGALSSLYDDDDDDGRNVLAGIDVDARVRSCVRQSMYSRDTYGSDMVNQKKLRTCVRQLVDDALDAHGLLPLRHSGYAKPLMYAQPDSTTDTRVSIRDFTYSPSTITVRRGTTVTWTNDDSAPHTVTDDNGRFGSTVLQQGQTYSYTFYDTGTFTYFCQLHPNMRGTVVVTD